MLDYVFFHATPAQHFEDYLSLKAIPFEKIDEEEIITISIAEDFDQEITTEIEQKYDSLMEMGSDILASQTGDGQINAAGLTVTLKDGRVSYAVLDPGIVNKVLTVLELEELNQLVNAIADAVENPDATPLCKRDYNN